MNQTDAQKMVLLWLNHNKLVKVNTFVEVFKITACMAASRGYKYIWLAAVPHL